jgi:hypothetical protein
MAKKIKNLIDHHNLRPNYHYYFYVAHPDWCDGVHQRVFMRARKAQRLAGLAGYDVQFCANQADDPDVPKMRPPGSQLELIYGQKMTKQQKRDFGYNRKLPKIET